MSAGWLTFLSKIGRKRLAPIPDGWGDMTDAELVHWLDNAQDTPLEEKRIFKQGID